MDVCCDLQVDVGGQEIFLVDKKLLSSFSCKLSHLFANLRDDTKNVKVIFTEFPGGAGGFELFIRFCYNNGKIEVNPTNIALLHYATNYMEMITNGSELKKHLEESLESINCWTCSELFEALKQCQDLSHFSGSVCLVQRLLDSFVERLASPSFSGSGSSFCFSSDSSMFRMSCDTRNTDTTLKTSFSRRTWWFEHLLFLRLDLIEKLLEALVSHKFDHGITSKFLFYYLKSNFSRANNTTEKRILVEIVINLLCLLEKNSIYYKGLFDIFQVALCLKLSKSCKNKLEFLIGSRLDQATLDDLLVPSAHSKDHIYNVNLVLRLLKTFLHDQGTCSSVKLGKVARLIDLYAMEVAPDFSLKPSKYMKLVRALPDDSRECHDAIYQAIDLYLEIHNGLCDEEKKKLCYAVNYKKLSSEALKHLTRNTKFPSKISIDARMYQNMKLESLNMNTQFVENISSCTRKEDEKLKQNSKGMHGMMKFQNLCMAKEKNLTKPRTSSQENTKFLPKLCS